MNKLIKPDILPPVKKVPFLHVLVSGGGISGSEEAVGMQGTLSVYSQDSSQNWLLFLSYDPFPLH